MAEIEKKIEPGSSMDRYIRKKAGLKDSNLPAKVDDAPVDGYHKAVDMAAERIDQVWVQAKVTRWMVIKSVHDAVSAAVTSFGEIHKGRKKKGEEHLTVSKVYGDIANKSRYWTPQTVKRAHLTYAKCLSFAGGDHDKIQEMATDPSTIETVILSAIPDESKKKLFGSMQTKHVTKQVARAEIKKIQDPNTGGVAIYHNTLWNLSHYDNRFGVEGVPGRTPGQIVFNLFYHYVDESSHCYFPFFGSGTEGDVASEFSCSYEAWDITMYDAVKTKHKGSAFQHDSTVKWPVKPQSADFIFMDPPRAILPDGKYSDDQSTIGSDGLANYMGLLGITASHADSALRVGGRIAVLLRQPYATEIPQDDFLFDAHQNIFLPKFDFMRRITVTFPRGIREPAGQGAMADGFLDLMVYEKH